MTHSMRVTLLALLFMTGCSSAPGTPDTAAHSVPNFAVDPTHPKVFFYVAYNNPDDRPFFDAAFTFRTDEGDLVDINADHYVELAIPPGNHVFNVDEILWTGNTTNHSTATVRIDPDKPNFVEEKIMPDGKAILSGVDAAQGEKEILARERKCLCRSGLRRLFENF
jgi:hypothetical protein